MKKSSFIVMAMFIMSTPVVFAQETTTTTTTTLSPTQSAPVTIALPESTDPWQASVQGGALWSLKDKSRLRYGSEIIGRLTYDVSPNFALGAESGGLHFEDASNGHKYGHLDGVPLMGDLVLKMPIAATGNRLVPYVYGAAGVIFWSYAKSSYSYDVGANTPDETRLAAKPGGGLEYYFSPNVSLFAEVSYLFSQRYKIDNASTTPPNGDIDTNALYGGGGIKIAF